MNKNVYPNRYSEWIFQYLEKDPEDRDKDSNNIGRMFGDFTYHFSLNWEWWTHYYHFGYDNMYNKLSFFWLLAHVDPETADSIIGR